MDKMRISIKIRNVLNKEYGNIYCIRNMGKVALTEKTALSCQNELSLKELFLMLLNQHYRLRKKKEKSAENENLSSNNNRKKKSGI